jgi:hypothetical protein
VERDGSEEDIKEMADILLWSSWEAVTFERKDIIVFGQ